MLSLFITRDDLLHAATRGKAVVSDKPTQPVLACVILDANDKGIDVTATDSAITYVGEFQANVSMRGRIALNAANLLEAVKSLPDGAVSMTLGANGRVTLKSGRVTQTLVTSDPAEYPTAPDVTGPTFTVDAKDVRRMLDVVDSSMAEDGNKFGFDGLKIHESKPGVLRFVASDGFGRFGWADGPYTGADPGPKLMVPKKGARELAAMLAGMGGDVTFTVGETSIVASIGGVRLHIRKQKDEFPAYERILPTTFARTAKFDREAALAAVRAVRGFSGNGLLRFAIGDGGDVTLTASYTDKGESEAGFQAELSGAPMTFACVVKIVEDALNSIGGTDIVLGFGKDDTVPVVMTTPEDERVLFLLMPARL